MSFDKMFSHVTTTTIRIKSQNIPYIFPMNHTLNVSHLEIRMTLGKAAIKLQSKAVFKYHLQQLGAISLLKRDLSSASVLTQFSVYNHTSDYVGFVSPSTVESHSPAQGECFQS